MTLPRSDDAAEDTAHTRAVDPQAVHAPDAQRQLLQAATAYSKALTTAGGEQMASRSHHGPGRVVCAALYRSPPYDLQVPALPVSRLALNLTSSVVSGGLDGEAARQFAATRYSIFMTPAGASAHWVKQTPSQHLTIYFDASEMEDGRSPLAQPSVRGLMNLNVPGLRPLLDRLVDELRRGDLHQAEAVDSLGWLLLIQVSRHLQQAACARGGLTALAAARVEAFAQEHLAERILVADLAEQAGMAVDRFAHDFKAHTGLSPHQFVMGLRLARAAELLRESRLSLTEVALACGFSSQQHLSNAMRRHRGTTPARLRPQSPRPG